jgi:predicted nuclease of predicted toxin-antitoxin system
LNILADESLERQVVDRLRVDGHSVLYVAEMEPSIADDVVLARANQHAALLITGDKDFGELVYRRRLVHLGVVLVRLEGLPASIKAAIVSDALAGHTSEVAGAFTVISSNAIRIRPPRG